MEQLKTYLLKNFEQAFVLLTLMATVSINYFIPQKIAFLNFYFLPIILGGYYLGRRKAVLGALLCVLVVGLYVGLDPESFQAGTSILDVSLHVTIWGGFLILAGAVVGKLHEKLTAEIEVGHNLNQELERHEIELREANVALKDYSTNLEAKVKERTDELEQSKQAVETLKAKVEEALYTTMDSSVVKLMIEGRLRNEKRNVSILFSDLVGFTAYSEDHPPEIVIRDLNRYLNAIEPILLGYRGHIDKYLGDGILCEFGAPLDYETYRLLGVLAGIKMQEKMAAGHFPWEMRVGIGSGSTITGLIGSKRQTYTAIGDVVNMAARLQVACTPGKVLIDRFTYEGVEPFIEGRRLRDLSTRETLDAEKERQLETLHEKLNQQADDAGLHFEIGRVHLELNEVPEAFSYFERALRLDPNNMGIKVAYADAGMKLKEAEKISVRGKRNRVEAFEVVGLKNPLDNPHKFPQRFIDEHRHILGLIPIPDDVILPVEALDASIGHSKVVAAISFALAGTSRLTDTEKLDVLQAAFLADIGKQAVPYHLLNRPGGLSTGELDLVKMHPMEGSKIIRNMGYDHEAMIKMVLHSHENFNGSGFPDGLSKDQIPLGARIIAVADAYNALTSWRPYRDPWDRLAALDEIRRGVGKGMYDPKIVESLVTLMT